MVGNSSFKVGLYIRLSRDDGNVESDSIVSQRSLLNQYIKENNCKVGISVKPNTKIEDVYEFLPHIHMCLVMTVEPGKGGQTLLKDMVNKIGTLKKYVEENDLELDIDKVESAIVKELATKYNKTPGQIALNWLIYLGIIPIPRTSSLSRMKENLGAMDFKLSKEDHDKMSKLNRNYRFCSTTQWKDIDCIDLFA